MSDSTKEPIWGKQGEWTWFDNPKAENQADGVGCSEGKCAHDHQVETEEPADLQEELLEEEFFLIYHLHMQPSEVTALEPDKRRWLISRFIHQKKCEKELMDHMRRGSVLTPDFLQEIERTKNG